MAQQDRPGVDWAARLRASLAPRPAAEPAPASVLPEAVKAKAEPPPTPIASPAPPENPPEVVAESALGAWLTAVTAAPEPAPPPPEAPRPQGLLSALQGVTPASPPPEAPAWSSPLLVNLGGPAATPPRAPLAEPRPRPAAPETAASPILATPRLAAKPPVPEAEVDSPEALADAFAEAQMALAATAGGDVEDEAPPPPKPAPLAQSAPAPEPAPAPAPAPAPVAQPAPAPQPAPVAKPAPAAKPAVAADAADPFAPAHVAAAFQAVTGTAMPPATLARLNLGRKAEWIALAHSLDTARDQWRAMFLGADSPDVPEAGALACAARGLAPTVLVNESNPGRSHHLQTSFDEKGLSDGRVRLVQAAIAAEIERLPPRGALVQDLLAEQESWDYLHINTPRLLPRLLTQALQLLSDRVRWLLLAPQARMEEAAAIKLLSGANWRLVAECPAVLRMARPLFVDRPGIQLWRGPLD